MQFLSVEQTRRKVCAGLHLYQTNSNWMIWQKPSKKFASNGNFGSVQLDCRMGDEMRNFYFSAVQMCSAVVIAWNIAFRNKYKKTFLRWPCSRRVGHMFGGITNVGPKKA